METNETTAVKRTVLDYDDIVKMAPFLNGKRRLVNWFMKLLDIDKVNWIHDHNFDTPGPQFCRGLLEDLNIKLRIDNETVLDNLPEGAFITISNHPFGALDGITLIDIIGRRRPDFK
ncbi:MAG: hemolysin, partial [Duncaniella sp.]|nr:hemolysin [Duncaniella sp.]